MAKLTDILREESDLTDSVTTLENEEKDREKALRVIRETLDRHYGVDSNRDVVRFLQEKQEEPLVMTYVGLSVKRVGIATSLPEAKEWINRKLLRISKPAQTSEPKIKLTREVVSKILAQLGHIGEIEECFDRSVVLADVSLYLQREYNLSADEAIHSLDWFSIHKAPEKKGTLELSIEKIEPKLPESLPKEISVSPREERLSMPIAFKEKPLDDALRLLEEYLRDSLPAESKDPLYLTLLLCHDSEIRQQAVRELIDMYHVSDKNEAESIIDDLVHRKFRSFRGDEEMSRLSSLTQEKVRDLFSKELKQKIEDSDPFIFQNYQDEANKVVSDLRSQYQYRISDKEITRLIENLGTASSFIKNFYQTVTQIINRISAEKQVLSGEF